LVQRGKGCDRQRFMQPQKSALASRVGEERKEAHAAINTSIEQLHKLPRQLPSEHIVWSGIHHGD
jgi:hypothetical protein